MEKKKVREYLIAIFIAVMIFIAGVYSQGLLEETETAEIFGTLSDCFLFPAVFLGGIGLLTWIAGEGAFDIMSYGMYMIYQRFTHPTQRIEGFYEYKMRKAESRDTWLKSWALVGLCCMVLSVICLVLYLNV